MILNLITSVCERVKASFSRISKDDKGIGVVEVILILVVLIGLVVIFRDQLTSLVNTIFGRIAEDAGGI
ncbi:MAG: hypothetical protein K6E49_09820 [Lachnospiraceae bacterium]|nr:hypothetical protein [Lachnospiraceae bacterium]